MTVRIHLGSAKKMARGLLDAFRKPDFNVAAFVRDAGQGDALAENWRKWLVDGLNFLKSTKEHSEIQVATRVICSTSK